MTVTPPSSATTGGTGTNVTVASTGLDGRHAATSARSTTRAVSPIGSDDRLPDDAVGGSRPPSLTHEGPAETPAPRRFASLDCSRCPAADARQVELERVLGTPALFATAYGNVGSSIYYALGLTAVFALGLTPLVFVVAGVIFAATAATYAEGTVRYPGGGRLVELRAARLQRARLVRRRVGADARLRRHRRDLGVLRPALPLDLLGAAAREPVGHRRRRDRDRRSSSSSTSSASRRRRSSRSRSRSSTSRRRCCSSRSASCSSSARRSSSTTSTGASAPTWANLAIAIPVAMLAYTGRGDRLEPRGGGARPGHERARARTGSSRTRSSRSTSRCPLIALSALPVKLIDGELTTLLALPPEEGGYANDPDPRRRREPRRRGRRCSTRSRSTSASSPRRSSSSPRTPA